jgi:hypothetical protein
LFYVRQYRPKVPTTIWKGSKSDYLLNLIQEEKIEEFNKTRKEGDEVSLYLPRIDLSEKNLSGVDLHDVDLTELPFNLRNYKVI